MNAPFDLDPENEDDYNLDDHHSAPPPPPPPVNAMQALSVHPVPPHRLHTHRMAGLPSPPNPADSDDPDSPFAWDPPAVPPSTAAGPGQRHPSQHLPYQPLQPDADAAYYAHSFDALQHHARQFGPHTADSQHAPPSVAGPSVPSLAYSNAGPYGPPYPRRSPNSSADPSPPPHHAHPYGGPDGYAGHQTHHTSPSVSPPNVSPAFDPASYPPYPVYTSAGQPALPPPIYTTHPPGTSHSGPASGSTDPPFSSTGTSPTDAAYHPRPLPLTNARYHPYAAAERAQLAAASGLPLPPTSATAAQRPFACQMCTYTSSRSHDLKRHLRTHTNERPYECEVCHRTFARKDAAKRHMAAKNCVTPGSGNEGSGSGGGGGSSRGGRMGMGGQRRPVDGVEDEQGGSEEEELEAGSASGGERSENSPIEQRGHGGMPDGVDGDTSHPPQLNEPQPQAATFPPSLTYPNLPQLRPPPPGRAQMRSASDRGKGRRPPTG